MQNQLFLTNNFTGTPFYCGPGQDQGFCYYHSDNEVRLVVSSTAKLTVEKRIVAENELVNRFHVPLDDSIGARNIIHQLLAKLAFQKALLDDGDLAEFKGVNQSFIDSPKSPVGCPFIDTLNDEFLVPIGIREAKSDGGREIIMYSDKDRINEHQLNPIANKLIPVGDGMQLNMYSGKDRINEHQLNPIPAHLIPLARNTLIYMRVLNMLIEKMLCRPDRE